MIYGKTGRIVFHGRYLLGGRATHYRLPVTFPKSDWQRSWYESLCEAVDEARKSWVTLNSNYEECIHELTKVMPRPVVVPQWPKWSVDDWITDAFGSRQIIHAEKKKTVVIEEDD